MADFIKVIGYVLLVAGALFVPAGYIGIVMTEGFGKLQEVLSPLNIWNWVAVVTTLAPGALLVWLGDWLIARR